MEFILVWSFCFLPHQPDLRGSKYPSSSVGSVTWGLKELPSRSCSRAAEAGLLFRMFTLMWAADDTKKSPASTWPVLFSNKGFLPCACPDLSLWWDELNSELANGGHRSVGKVVEKVGQMENREGGGLCGLSPLSSSTFMACWATS